MFNFLGLGKKKEFFVEAEPVSNSASTQAASAGVGQPETAPVAAPAPVEAATVAPEAPAAKSGKTSIRSKAKESNAADASPTAAPAAPVASTNGTVPSSNGAAPASATFAASNLLINATSRRRPGPSLDKFKAMAKEIRR